MILFFYKVKLAKNEPEISNFQNLPEKQVSNPLILGIVVDKKGSPFLDSNIGSLFFVHPDIAKSARFGPGYSLGGYILEKTMKNQPGTMKKT